MGGGGDKGLHLRLRGSKITGGGVHSWHNLHEIESMEMKPDALGRARMKLASEEEEWLRTLRNPSSAATRLTRVQIKSKQHNTAVGESEVEAVNQLASVNDGSFSHIPFHTENMQGFVAASSP